MSNMKRHLEDLGELAMMGVYVPVQSTGEAETVANYIINCISSTAHEVHDLDGILNQYSDNNPKHQNKVTHLSTYRLMDMNIISFLLENDADENDEWYLPKHDNKNYPYRFSYALNLTCPECSELGDVCVYRQMDNTYRLAH